MRRSTLWPAGALILGGGAAVLRMWQRASGYDASGLPVPGAVSAAVLTAFLVLCSGAFLAAALSRPRVLESQSSAAPHGRSAALLLGASGVLIMAAGAVNLKTFADGWLEVDRAVYASPAGRQEALRLFLSDCLFPLALALLSVPTAIALLLRARRSSGPVPPQEDEPAEPDSPEGDDPEGEAADPEEAGEDGGAPKRGARVRTFAALMPPFYCWLWLVEAYRRHTSSPILWDYVLLLFAVLALLISGYFRAGFAFGVGRPRRSVWVSLLALFFAVAALPDAGDAATVLALASLVLHALAELTALLSALENTPPQTETKEELPHE